MENGVTPLCGPWRMENGEWELPLPPACGKSLCSIHMLGFELRCLIHHALFVVWIPGERRNPMWKIIKPFMRSFLRSPFFTHGEEVFSILHSPISENGPSDIQGERATSPFSNNQNSSMELRVPTNRATQKYPCLNGTLHFSCKFLYLNDT